MKSDAEADLVEEIAAAVEMSFRGINHDQSTGGLTSDISDTIQEEADEAKPEPVAARTRFCVRCGRPCGSGETICRECRSKEETLPDLNCASTSAGPKKKHRVVPFLLGFMIALAIAAICFAVYFVISGGMNDLINPAHRSSISEAGVSSSDDAVLDRSETEDLQAGSEEGNAPTESDETGDEEEQAEDEDAEEVFVADGETALEGTQAEDEVLYFILHCDSEYFSPEDLELFDADMCRIARNGIYARLGRKFQDETLQAYFEQYDWYQPVIEPEDFTESMLNDYQIKNRDLIVAYEEEHGYR